jgi:hypothetical protein
MDIETCSRCLNEFPWTELNHVIATGENVCDADIVDGEETEPVE